MGRHKKPASRRPSSSGGRRSVNLDKDINTLSLKRLAPLDHIKNLYDGAAASFDSAGDNDQPRRIFAKKDLLDAVRQMNQSTSTNSIKSMKQLKDNTKEGKKETKKHTKSLPPVAKRDSGESNSSSGNQANEITGDKKQKTAIEVLQETLHINARKYNELKMLVEKREIQLKQATDEMRELKLENEELKKMEEHKTGDTERIDQIHGEITEISDSLEAKLARRQQLEHMKRRLQLNQVAFDAHIKGMEDALIASNREFEEVKLLMRQLEAGNSRAQEELKQTSELLIKERDMRNKQMHARRQEAANAKRMEQWRKQRERQRLDFENELQEGEGDGSEEKKKDEEAENELASLAKRATQRVNTYEEAFAQIRESTGVRTLDEMVEKFLGQGANKAALLEEKAEAEARQAEVKEQLRRIQEQFSELKAAGLGGSELNREMYDRLDDEILKARQELKNRQEHANRLESVLVKVRAGMLGLQHRLVPFNYLLDYEEEVSLPHTGIEALDATLACELKLIKLLEAVNFSASSPAAELSSPSSNLMSPINPLSAMASSRALQEDPSMHSSSHDLFSPTEAPLRQLHLSDKPLRELEQPQLHANNIRVKPLGACISPVDSARSTSSKKKLSAELATEDSDEEDVVNAQQLKRAAKSRYHKAVEKQRQEDKRKKTMNSLAEAKRKKATDQKAAAGRLAKSSRKEQDKKKRAFVTQTLSEFNM